MYCQSFFIIIGDFTDRLAFVESKSVPVDIQSNQQTVLFRDYLAFIIGAERIIDAGQLQIAVWRGQSPIPILAHLDHPIQEVCRLLIGGMTDIIDIAVILIEVHQFLTASLFNA